MLVRRPGRDARHSPAVTGSVTTPSWARERGSLILLRLMMWIALNLGWQVARALLVAIAAYFFATAPRGRAASRDYLIRVQGRASHADVFRHMFTFASAILESVFLLAGRTAKFRIRLEGVDALKAMLARGQGCVLLGAHFGSFEVLRAVSRESPVAVRPVMFRRGYGFATRVLETLDPDLAARTIELGQPDAMLQIREAVLRGELVALLADRSLGEKRLVRAPFLGSLAAFPSGPWMLAAALSAPVLLFFGVRTGPREYLVQFEPFAERVLLPRADRSGALRAWVCRYAEALESRCRLYPLNWFNFYPFWAEVAP